MSFADDKAAALAHYQRLAFEAQSPQEGSALITLNMGDAEVLIEYEYTPGEESFISGPPENCYEGSPEELAILGVFVNAVWCDPNDFASAKQIELWEQSILSHIAEQIEEQRADAQIDARIAAREYA